MTDRAVTKDVRADIALKVCSSFIDQAKPVSRRELLLEYGNWNVLDEMSTRGLLRENPNNRDCLPSAGSFALLGEEHELYLRARDAFAQMITALWRFYRLEYGQEEYQDEALWKSLAELPEPRVEMQVQERWTRAPSGRRACPGAVYPRSCHIFRKSEPGESGWDGPEHRAYVEKPG